MAIVDCEYLNLRPLLICYLRLFGSRLDDIENDGDSVLVGLPHETNMCVGCERPNNSEPLVACF